MTEKLVRKMLTVLEAERDGRLGHARDCEDLAATIDLVRNDLADWKLSAHRGIPIPEDAIDAIRKRLADVSERIVDLGSQSALACEAIARLVPPAPQPSPGEPKPVDPNADTLDMALDELAESNARAKD